jgi:hypothetical protein
MFKYFFPKVIRFIKLCAKNMVQPDRPKMTIWYTHMLFKCWITETKDNSEYAVLIAFHSTKCLRERASVLRYSTLPHLLSAFVKLRKATLSFDMSACMPACLPVCLAACLPACLFVCPPFRPSAWKNSPQNWRIVMSFDIWVFFRKSVDNIQVSLKSDKNNGYFTWRPLYIFDHTLITSF